MPALLSLLFFTTLLLAGCRQEGPAIAPPIAKAVPQPVIFDPAGIPFPKLSDYGFFAGGPAHQQPNLRVVPYDLRTPLFSDYALKKRFVWMPEGAGAAVADNGDFIFPEGAILIKTFYYPADFRQPGHNHTLIETRLLVRQDSAWQAYTYIWNEEQTGAELSIVGDYRSMEWIDAQGRSQSVEYLIPNKNQCRSCHSESGKLMPIGPKLRHLNYDNQLAGWQRVGYLPEAEFGIGAVPAYDDPGQPLAVRARAYLDVNCGHCHRAEGPAHTTGMFLNYEETDPLRLGWCKTPVAAGKGSGGRQYGIVPGEPGASILLYRMESNDPGVMMPEIGRGIAHAEGIALIRDWIEALPGGCE